MYAFVKENIEYKNLDEIIADDENKSYISQLINLIQEKILEQVIKFLKTKIGNLKIRNILKTTNKLIVRNMLMINFT